MTIFAGVKSRGFLKKPLVFNVHLPQLPGPSFHLENLGLVAADLVIVNSEAMREQLIAREVPIRQIEVVPNGVDAATFSPAPDWPVDDGYILFVGRLVEQKGIDTLLKAFGVVLHQCADARLVIAGDGELELYLKRLIRNLGFPHRVSFVNWQTGPALVKLYQRAQVVVVPSYFEPFGMVALEAMACGRPVIASSVGGLKEIIEDDVQGYLVPTGDYLQLAQRLAHLILNPARRQEMGKAARIHASRFTWDAIGAKIVNLYEDLLGKAIMLDDQEIIFRQRDELLSWLENYAGRVEANWPSLLDLEKF
jgi:glycogen(starch) synthase